MGTLATVRLPHISGLSEDSVVNDWAIDATAEQVAQSQAAVNAAMVAFYNTADTNGFRVSEYISGLISRATTCEIRYYSIDSPAELAGGRHGSPFASHTFTLGAENTGVDLPEEIACVLTLEALGRGTAEVEDQAGATRPKQRRSGRVYIGPLNGTAVEVSGTRVIPAANLTRAMRLNAVRLDQALDDAGTGIMGLAVWSRRDAMFRPLEAVSTDNAFDTQRRRGTKATARTRLVTI